MVKNENLEEVKYSRTKRAREISAILIKYGFEIAVVDIVPNRIKKIFRKNEPIIVPIPIVPKLVKVVKGSPEISSLNIYRRFRLAIQELGPVFVKFGQIMSTRQESLPPELIKELKLLNNNVEAVPFREIKSTIERYTGPIQNSFSLFNEKSFAAASLSQEYRAKLKDGTDVVLKVQRPEIREKVTMDLSILKYLAKRSKSFNDLKIYNLSGIIEDFSKQITAELDFVRDGKNAEIFSYEYEGNGGNSHPKNLLGIFWKTLASDGIYRRG